MTNPVDITTTDPVVDIAASDATNPTPSAGGEQADSKSPTSDDGSPAKASPPPIPHGGGSNDMSIVDGAETGGQLADDAPKDAGSKSGDGTKLQADASDKMGDPKEAAVSRVRGLIKSQHGKGKSGAEKLGSVAAEKLAKVPFAPAAVRGGARYLPLVGSFIAGTMAIDDFKNQRWVPGILNTIGVIPGPVGWLGMGAAAVYKLFYGGGSGTAYGLWEEPDGVNTFMLPAAAGENENVVLVDKALTDAQREVFGFADGPSGTVWNSNAPAPLRVDSPEVAEAITMWLADVADVFHQLQSTMAATGEPYIAEQIKQLAPHFTAMAALPESGRLITSHLAAASSAAGDWYHSVLETNKAARTQLAQGGTLTDSAVGQQLNDVRRRSRDAIAAADQKISDLVSDKVLTPSTVTPRGVPVGRTASGDQPAAGLPLVGPPPAVALTPPLTPTAQPPQTPTTQPEKGKGDTSDEISKFLDSLRNATPGGTPLGGGGNPLGGMPLGGMPMGGMPLGGAPLGGTPLGGGTPLNPGPKPTPLVDPADKPKLATERSSLSAAPPENKMVTPTKTPADRTEAVTPAAPGAAASATPASLGDKPVTGEGASNKPAAKPDAEDRTVDVKGRKVEFPDAKHASLARELATGTPGAPASLADAATKAGLVPPVPGQDPGQQVAPADAKPGHLLRAGDKDYMLLGEGKFLDFSNGKVVDADQLPQDLGPKGGYFKLLDAAGGPQPGPVSGQTPDTTTFTVDRSQTVPTDASPGASPAPQTPTPASPAADSAGVTSAGSPGVPDKGTGGGPANAAATDTGLGTGTVTVGKKPLDPTAIR